MLDKAYLKELRRKERLRKAYKPIGNKTTIICEDCIYCSQKIYVSDTLERGYFNYFDCMLDKECVNGNKKEEGK